MKRILVLEDDEAFRKVVVATLTREGYQLLEAGDGATGLEMARAQVPDLIVSDVYMPNMTGIEVLTTLRGDPMIATTPFILMTCETEKVSMRTGMGLGADDYLAKPFSLRELVEAVKTRLHRHQQVQERAETKMETLRANLSTTLPHELQTPLAGILGYAELIRVDYESLRPVDIMEMSWGIEKCALRLQRLIQNYLLYADIVVLGKNPERLKALAQKATASSRKVIVKAVRSCALRHTRLEDLVVELADGPVHMGEEFLRKVVDELVDNACKFSAHRTPVRVASTYAGEHLILTVRDEGRGMTPQQIRDIGAYRQFDREKYEQQGMGLGLYIAQRLTELYQGGFMVRSESGKGTTVEVRLPVPPPLPRLRNNQRTELRFGLRASPKGLSLAAPWKKASARGCD